MNNHELSSPGGYPEPGADIGSIAHDRDIAHDREAAALLASLVHDIRTPLSAMAGWLEVLEAELGSSAGLVERALAGLRRGIDSQTQVVNGVSQTLARFDGAAVASLPRRPLHTVLEEAFDSALALPRGGEAGDAMASPWMSLRAIKDVLAEAASPECIDAGEALDKAAAVLLEALVLAQRPTDPPWQLTADRQRIRFRSPVAQGDRTAIRALCTGLGQVGARRPTLPSQAIWLARIMFERCGIALRIEEAADGLDVFLIARQPRAGRGLAFNQPPTEKYRQ